MGQGYSGQESHNVYPLYSHEGDAMIECYLSRRRREMTKHTNAHTHTRTRTRTHTQAGWYITSIKVTVYPQMCLVFGVQYVNDPARPGEAGTECTEIPSQRTNLRKNSTPSLISTQAQFRQSESLSLSPFLSLSLCSSFSISCKCEVAFEVLFFQLLFQLPFEINVKFPPPHYFRLPLRRRVSVWKSGCVHGIPQASFFQLFRVVYTPFYM